MESRFFPCGLRIFHPNNESYQVIEISPAYDMYINKLVRWRKEQ